MAEPFFFCGTTTGDIIGINMRTRFFQVQGPKKELFSLGVTALALLKSGDFLVGAGDGEVALVKFFKKPDKKEVMFEKKRYIYILMSFYDLLSMLISLLIKVM